MLFLGRLNRLGRSCRQRWGGLNLKLARSSVHSLVIGRRLPAVSTWCFSRKGYEARGSGGHRSGRLELHHARLHWWLLVGGIISSSSIRIIPLTIWLLWSWWSIICGSILCIVIIWAAWHTTCCLGRRLLSLRLECDSCRRIHASCIHCIRVLLHWRSLVWHRRGKLHFSTGWQRHLYLYGEILHCIYGLLLLLLLISVVVELVWNCHVIQLL